MELDQKQVEENKCCTDCNFFRHSPPEPSSPYGEEWCVESESTVVNYREKHNCELFKERD